MINMTADYMSIGKADARSILKKAGLKMLPEILTITVGDEEKAAQFLREIEGNNDLIFDFFVRLSNRADVVASEMVREEISKFYDSIGT